MLNNMIYISGRLGADPKFGETKTGLAYAKLWIKVISEVRKKEGFVEEVCFVGTTVWGNNVEMVRSMTKGSPLICEGRLQNNEYVDKNGATVKTYVIKCDNIITKSSLEFLKGEDDPADQLALSSGNAQTTIKHAAVYTQDPTQRQVSNSKAKLPANEQEAYNDDLPF